MELSVREFYSMYVVALDNAFSHHSRDLILTGLEPCNSVVVRFAAALIVLYIC